MAIFGAYIRYNNIINIVFVIITLTKASSAKDEGAKAQAAKMASLPEIHTSSILGG